MEANNLYKVKELDEKAFENIFKEFFSGLTAFSRKYVHDLDTAKEIVHDVFMNLWEKRATVDPEKSIKSYLFTAVYNRSLNYLRDNKKFDKNEFSLEIAENNPDNWDHQDSLETSELQTKINDAIDSLPEKCREIFVMNRLEGLKYKEVAEKLNISIKTVETQMSKALKVLKENLAEYATLLIISLIFLL